MSGERRDIDDGERDAVVDPDIVKSREFVRRVIGRPGYAFADRELLANVRAMYELAAMVDAAKLGLVAALQDRPEAVPGARAGRGAVTFLTEALRVSGPQANRDVAAATAVNGPAPELPRMGQALIDGEVSRDHVDVAVSTLNRLPKSLKKKIIIIEPEQASEPAAPEPAGPEPAGDDRGEPVRRTGADVIDEVLTGQARLLPPSTVDRLGRQIVARLDPDRAERFTADADERRSATMTTDFAGMGVYKVILDAATHLQVRALIAQCSAPRPTGQAITDSGEVVQVKDTRTTSQRRADAIADLILAGGQALTTDHPTTSSDEAAHGDPADRDQPSDGDHPTGDDTDRPADGQDTDVQDAEDDGASEDGPGSEVRDSAIRDSEVRGNTEDPQSSRTTGCAQPAGSLPAGVFMARPVVAAEISVVATLGELLTAFAAGTGGEGRPAATGLARATLAGSIGNYPGATIDPHLLARLACDSPLYRVIVDDHGAILHHGRGKRFASTPQKRALAVRDGGCIIPGCHAPPEWCEAHHLIPWTHGGRTDIDAMALLCVRHHTAHHAGVYALEMRDGIPWVRLPGWQDPTRPWLRNHTHDHQRLADTTAATITGQPPPHRTTERSSHQSADHAA